MGRVMGKFGLPSRKSPRTIIKRLWIFFKGGGTSLQLVLRLRSFVWCKMNDRMDRYFLDSLKSNPYKRIVKIRRRGRWSLENLWGRKEKEEGRKRREEEMFDKTCPVVDFPDFRLFFLGKPFGFPVRRNVSSGHDLLRPCVGRIRVTVPAVWLKRE